MKIPPLRKAIALIAAVTVPLGLVACQGAKNAGQGGKSQECAECEKPAGAGVKRSSFR
jgi:hypothetical protein